MSPRETPAAEAAVFDATPCDGDKYSRRFLVPPAELSIKAIRDAIPPHCFERSLARSLAHLVGDLALVALLATAIWVVDAHPVLGKIVPRWAKRAVLWPLYWWWQGACMTGIWVLAHECGHQAFSPSKLVNDAFGLVLHSALLVPYHSWRITHGQHHKATNHVDRDQVFVPATLDEYVQEHGVEIKDKGATYTYRSPLVQALEESPIGDMVGIVKMLVLGWPAYLTMNSSGQAYGPGSNHFNPFAAMFSKRDRWDVILSDLGMAAAFACIVKCIFKFGFKLVVKYYFIPYLFVNMWLVLITYMQHSDPDIPHYAGSEWNFVRGALCSVDRDYGVYNILHHHIGDTHVAHHLFSQMPFYHAQEATAAIKKVLGPYYNADKTPVALALFRSWRTCKFVDPSDGPIMWYYNMRSLAKKNL